MKTGHIKAILEVGAAAVNKESNTCGPKALERLGLTKEDFWVVERRLPGKAGSDGVRKRYSQREGLPGNKKFGHGLGCCRRGGGCSQKTSLLLQKAEVRQISGEPRESDRKNLVAKPRFRREKKNEEGANLKVKF